MSKKTKPTNSLRNKEMYLPIFGKYVRALRQGFSLSQAALAEKAYSKQEYISSLERGKSEPGLADAFALAEALDMTNAAFFDGFDTFIVETENNA